MPKEVPPKLDWVDERAKCSIEGMFEQLTVGVREDVEKINALGSHGKFETILSGNVLNVYRIHSGAGRSAVFFKLKESAIAAYDTDGQTVMFEAAVTLNDFGECRLKVKEQERELWQVRRAALETFFFGDAGAHG